MDSRVPKFAAPDFALAHRELKRKGVTLTLPGLADNGGPTETIALPAHVTA